MKCRKLGFSRHVDRGRDDAFLARKRASLSSLQQIEEKRPWDLRLVESMSRGSNDAGPTRTSQVVIATTHGLLFGVPAAVSGRLYLEVFAALYPLILFGRYLRDRAKRQRAGRTPAGSAPNPFGQ